MERNSKKSYRFESLEERSVMAASAFAAVAKAGPTLAAVAKLNEVAPPAFFAPPSANIKATLPSLPSMTQSSSLVAAKGSPQTLTETRLIATIVDPTGTNTAVGFARYESATINGVVQKTFTVAVSGAVAGTPLTVTVGGVDVGTITPDSEGNGKLSFATTPKNSQSSAFPTNFPATIDTTTSVKIGADLTGSFSALPNKPFVPSPGANVKGSPQTLTETRLVAALADPTGTNTAIGFARYQSATINGVVQKTFTVNVSGAVPGVPMTITVGGVVVGTITPNSEGEGKLSFATTPKNGQSTAFPADFPLNIDSTTIVKIGADLTGSFSALPNKPFVPKR